MNRSIALGLLWALVGCANRETSPPPAAPRLAVADSLYPYQTYRSSDDPLMFKLRSRGTSDTLVNGRILVKLDSLASRHFARPLAAMLGVDTDYVATSIALYPIAQLVRPGAMTQTVVQVSGDDLGGQLLFVGDSSLHYGVILTGGIQAGPEFESESLMVAGPVVTSRLSHDTIFQRVQIAAEFAGGQPNLVDSGEVGLRLGSTRPDTLYARGILSTKAFLTRYPHLKETP